MPIAKLRKDLSHAIMVTTLLLVVGLLLTFARSKTFQKIANVFDITYFLILGLMGCFMLFMWFGTDHELCRDNYNLLWALPTHLIAVFYVQKKCHVYKKILRSYRSACTGVLSSGKYFPRS